MKKKEIVEDKHDNRLANGQGVKLTETEVNDKLKNTRKIDVETLLSQGYRKLEDVCNDIENGFVK
ncbi:MAG: hypothetical protein K2K77_00840 [Duncaniella sp.]|nr:hypothetical protein [Duncaniella sp.]